jgi:hypothetical protein
MKLSFFLLLAAGVAMKLLWPQPLPFLPEPVLSRSALAHSDQPARHNPVVPPSIPHTKVGYSQTVPQPMAMGSPMLRPELGLMEELEVPASLGERKLPFFIRIFNPPGDAPPDTPHLEELSEPEAIAVIRAAQQFTLLVAPPISPRKTEQPTLTSEPQPEPIVSSVTESISEEDSKARRWIQAEMEAEEQLRAALGWDRYNYVAKPRNAR